MFGGKRLTLQQAHINWGYDTEMDKDQQNRITYTVYCINAFAERYRLTAKQAFAYLDRFGGMAFLEDCYEAEHQLSIIDAVNDLTQVCRNQGGKL